MAFHLSRGGNNVPLEVQRWQYFLRRHGFAQAGRIDGQFGMKTEDASTLGYKIVENTFYDDKKSARFPPKPDGLRSPANEARNAGLGCYKFKQLPRANRGDQDGIVILSSCDGTISDWQRENIVTISIPEPVFAVGFDGTITCHKSVAPHIKALFARWRELDLLHLLSTFAGAFNPRYKRNQSPSPQGHGVKRSDQVSALSNHAFGSAFDYNAEDNPLGAQPVLVPSRGCVRELVAAANELGFFWGGHFGSPKDGMHFEFADFENL